jgi:hypothetical protein
VIRLKNNEFDLQYEAFENQSYLSLCNGVFTYNEEKKILKFKLDTQSLKENLEDKFNTKTKIYNSITEEYYKNSEFSLTFNGKNFQ